MKVVHVVAGSPHASTTHGPSRYLHFLARAQAKLGLDVAVLGLTKEPPAEVEGVRVRTFRPSRVPFTVPAALRAALEESRPDVLHLHSPYYPPNAVLASWARRAGVPYVVSPHGALSPGEMRERWLLKAPYKALFERRLLNRAAFVHAVGAHEALERYGVRAPIVLASSGIDPAIVPVPLERDALASRHPALRGRRIFLYVGRLDCVQKGLDVLLQAFRAAALDGVALVLAGPDWRGGRGVLEQMARRIAGPVLVLGPLHGRMVFDCMAGAHVFVHPSRWEGMPMAVLEAAAVGLPSLLTPCADPLGMLAAADASVSVEARVPSLVQGLRGLASRSAAELRAMGARARAVVAGLGWERPAAVLAEAYERAIADGRGRHA